MKLFLLLVSLAAATPASASELVFDCVPQRAFICSSDRGCSPQEFQHAYDRITVPFDADTNDLAETGTIQACTGSCGSDGYTVSTHLTLGNSLIVSHLQLETWDIDLKTGFYTRSYNRSGSASGSVEATFGVCTRR